MSNRKKQRSKPVQPKETGETMPQGTRGASDSLTSLRALFAIDTRSLAVFRIAMGALLLADLAMRTPDLRAMYTDEGMFSRMEISRRLSSIWNWSFHFGSGSWGYEAVLFGIAAVLAVMVLIGFETRLATIGSWVMLLSLQHRVPPILSGADILMRSLLFWGMFLPLERAWSVDRRLRMRASRDDEGEGGGTVLSIASGAILLQMALMYLFSAIYKSNGDWFRGEAIAGALAHSFYAKPLGAWLLQYPRVLTGLTWVTFALEWLAPVLLFFPKRTAWVRSAGIFALAAMHVGIALCLEVDFFSPVSLAGLTLFLPREFWESPLLARFVSPAEQGPASVGGDSSRGFTAAATRFNYVTQGACAVLLLCMVGININSLPSHPFTREAPVKASFLRTALGLGQKWNMFDEIPSRSGWYVARARLKDGSEVDLLRNGAPIDWNRPSFPAGKYPNHRWRKCFREIAYDDVFGYQLFRVPVAHFLCRDWNARSGPARQVTELALIYCLDGPAKTGANSQTGSREELVKLDWSDPEGILPVAPISFN